MHSWVRQPNCNMNDIWMWPGPGAMWGEAAPGWAAGQMSVPIVNLGVGGYLPTLLDSVQAVRLPVFRGKDPERENWERIETRAESRVDWGWEAVNWRKVLSRLKMSRWEICCYQVWEVPSPSSNKGNWETQGNRQWWWWKGCLFYTAILQLWLLM